MEPWLCVKAYLKFRARLKGEQSRKIRHRVMEALEACALEDLGEARIGSLSHGQRRRVALADALLLRPRFLLVDDLFAGLDASARATVAKALSSVSQFASIIVSGHELEELDRCASRFLVLKDGKIEEAKGVAAARKAMSA